MYKVVIPITQSYVYGSLRLAKACPTNQGHYVFYMCASKHDIVQKKSENTCGHMPAPSPPPPPDWQKRLQPITEHVERRQW